MKIVRLDPNDNVAIARSELNPGVIVPELDGQEVIDRIPRFHKMAVTDIAAGAVIRKYNQIIGVALCDIRAGQHVHDHNCGMAEFKREGSHAAEISTVSSGPTVATPATFMGFPRPTGKVGTRNYIGIVTSVNCSATVAKKIEKHFADGTFLAEYPSVDGVVALTHATGCGMGKVEQYGPAQPRLQGVCHPSQFRRRADDRPRLRGHAARRFQGQERTG